MFPETTAAKVYREDGVIYATTPLVGVSIVKGPAQAWKKIHKAGGEIVADSYAEWISWFGPDESVTIGGESKTGSRLVLK